MPFAVMIAGPNGSGKSTLIAELARRGIDLGEYLNADDIARGLQGSPASVAAEAQEQVRRLRNSALEEQRDHSFETVLSHPSHIDHLRLARAAGFQVFVYFVATNDPNINIGRVANRVFHGGHDVPQDRIAARYFRSIGNLPEAFTVAHEGTVFDNSRTADPMRAIAQWDGETLLCLLPERELPRWWLDCLPAFMEAGIRVLRK